MPSNDSIFELWAPPTSPWSPWAKPVLFAHLNIVPPPEGALVETAPAHLPPADGTTAIVLDLPGALGISAALTYARNGYRPIPLYNAIPTPSLYGAAQSTCDLIPIISSLILASETLAQLDLHYSAPPVFLLDSLRRTGTGNYPAPGMFDNRSVSLPTDFPSANILLSHNIRSVLLVTHTTLTVEADLAHTLRRWQDAGLQIYGSPLQSSTPPELLNISKPNLFRIAWQRALATFGLKKNPLGGFGGYLPIPSQSSGGRFGGRIGGFSG